MNITAAKFLKTVNKDNLPHLVLGLGEEDYYKEELAHKLTAVLFGDLPEEERSAAIFDGKASLPEVQEAINTYPFFAGQNLVVLRNLQLLEGEAKAASAKTAKDREQLLQLLQDIPPYAYVLVLCNKLDKRTKLYSALSKSAAVVTCDSIKYYSLKPWLDEQAASYGARFDYKAIALISEYMSITETVPLSLLKQEIDKLAIYAGQRTQWTQEDVENIFADLPAASAFAVGNAVTEGRLVQFLELVALEKKKGTNILPLVGGVTTALRRLCLLKELVEAGERPDALAAKLHMHPYVVKLNVAASQRFTLASLRHAMVELTQLNIKMRLGGRTFERLEEIVVELIQQNAK